MKITQDSRSSGRNLNLVHPKYEAEVLNSTGDAMWQVESCMGCNIAPTHTLFPSRILRPHVNYVKDASLFPATTRGLNNKRHSYLRRLNPLKTTPQSTIYMQLQVWGWTWVEQMIHFPWLTPSNTVVTICTAYLNNK